MKIVSNKNKNINFSGINQSYILYGTQRPSTSSNIVERCLTMAELAVKMLSFFYTKYYPG